MNECWLVTYRLICTYSEICLTKHRPLKFLWTTFTYSHILALLCCICSILSRGRTCPSVCVCVCVFVCVSKGCNCLQFSTVPLHCTQTPPCLVSPSLLGSSPHSFHCWCMNSFKKTCAMAYAFLIDLFFLYSTKRCCKNIKPFYSL